MTPTARDTAAAMLVEIVKLPIGERADVLAMVIRVLGAPDLTTNASDENETTEEMR